jgi:hypothetical protein
MLPPLLSAVLAAAVVAGPAVPPPAAIPSVPDEPEAVVLPEAQTIQAVAADIDGDGIRELVRLVRGESNAIAAEVWAERSGGWTMTGEVEVAPPSPLGGSGVIVWAGAPVRLVVRHGADHDIVTVARQPTYRDPGLEGPCCLRLDDLRLDDRLHLVQIEDAVLSVDAIFAIDMDGDGIDELVTTRSEPPLGDINFPTRVLVYRATGDRLSPPVSTRLLVGSGDLPFAIGDSDGRPGDELAVVTRLGTGRLFRIALRPGDQVIDEGSGIAATDARAVPVGEGRGIAIIDDGGTVTVHEWPPGGAPGPALGSAIVPDGAILGTITVGGDDRLMVGQPSPEALHALYLPDLSFVRARGITRSEAAAAFASGPVTPFLGVVPRGGPSGEELVVFEGRIMPVDTGDDAPFPPGGTELVPAMAGALPVGLVGRGWIALIHSHIAPVAVDPSGGVLAAPGTAPGSGVSLVPYDTFLGMPEQDSGHLDPPVADAVPLDDRDTLAVGADGFTVRLDAPAGARVYLAEADPSVVASVRVVPAGGSLDVRIVPQPAANGGRQRVSIAVVTPGGRSYLASWEVRLLTVGPDLEASVSTPLGSDARVEGRTAPYATVTVAGVAVPVDGDGRFAASVAVPPWPTGIVVTATDPVGNVSSFEVSGVGIFDYRTLPWIPIVVVLVAVAGIVLYLRVPHLRPTPRAAGDDSILEEVDPD